MARLVLVRHTAVEVLDGVPPRDWPVTEEGRRAAERLARDPAWRELTYVATSPEAKAVETARPLARAAELAPHVDEGLREVGRDLPVLPHADYVALVTRYLAGENVPGFEPKEHAERRFAAAIRRAAAASPGPAAVVTHGLVLALHLRLPPDAWAAMPLPGIVAVIESPEAGYQRPTP